MECRQQIQTRCELEQDLREPKRANEILMNRPGMSGDSIPWEGWSHVRWFIEEVPAGAA